LETSNKDGIRFVIDVEASIAAGLVPGGKYFNEYTEWDNPNIKSVFKLATKNEDD